MGEAPSFESENLQPSVATEHWLVDEKFPTNTIKPSILHASIESFVSETSDIINSSLLTRSEYGFGKNRFTNKIKELKTFQKKNLKHMMVKASSTKKSKTSLFNKFYLFSALYD